MRGIMLPATPTFENYAPLTALSTNGFLNAGLGANLGNQLGAVANATAAEIVPMVEQVFLPVTMAMSAMNNFTGNQQPQQQSAQNSSTAPRQKTPMPGMNLRMSGPTGPSGMSQS